MIMTSPKEFTSSPVGSIPNDWQVRRLTECANIDSDNLDSKTAGNYTFSYISLSDVENGQISKRLPEFQFSEAPSRARRVVKTGDVLLATVRPNLQNFIRIRNAEGSLIASTGYSVIRANDASDGEFLYQLLYSDSTCSQIDKLVVGSNYPAINSSDVKNLLIPFPPLPEQKKIARILSSVDSKLALIDQQITTTQTLKKGLMQMLFTQGVGTQDADGRWQPHTEFQETELGRIPAGWKSLPVGSVLEMVERPVNMDDVTEYQLVTVKRRYGGVVRRSVLKGSEIKVKSQFYLEAGDFLISKRQIVHGACGIVGNHLSGAIVSNEYHSLRAIAGFDLQYLSLLVQQPHYLQSFLHASIGVHIEKMLFKYSQWAKVVIPVPPLEEQRHIVAIFSLMEKKVENLQTQKAQTQQLKKGLMQKLLTGKIRVQPDPQDH